MNEMQQLAAKAALAKMLESGWMDICTIDKILKISGGIPDRADYQTLHLLHCVHFDKMDRALLAQLPDIIERVLDAPDIFNVMAKERRPAALTVVANSPRPEPTPAPAAGMRRLLGRLLGNS